MKDPTEPPEDKEKVTPKTGDNTMVAEGEETTENQTTRPPTESRKDNEEITAKFDGRTVTATGKGKETAKTVAKYFFAGCTAVALVFAGAFSAILGFREGQRGQEQSDR